MNKQTLAREILESRQHIEHFSEDAEEFVHNCSVVPFHVVNIELLEKAEKLAQLVLEEDFEGFQSHMDSITTAISIDEQIAKAKQEQKEKDAEIVETFPDSCCDECNKQIAKKIRAS